MNNALEKIGSVGVLPVIKIEELSYAKPLAAALLAGGMNAIEVTFRSDVAADAVKAIKDAYPEMVVGAGTILSPELADKAIAAGSDLIVSPGFNPVTVDHCIGRNVPIVPGCGTPSEMEIAVAKGLKVVKFFPAELGGGVDALKLLSGPFPQLKFVPTGGINYNNLGNYLRQKFVAACGGSYMAGADLIREGQWEKITENCLKALEISLGFELAHVGINNPSKDVAVANVERMNKIFPLGAKIGSGKSSFLGTAVEFMHNPFYGSNGHIGFKTNSPERAKAFFEKQGFMIREDSIAYDKDGSMKFFYIEEEIGGFALHVVRK